MLKETAIAGMALALTCLPAAAETESDYVIGDWGHVEPSIPAYQPNSADLPLTGAARFEANRSVELDAMLEAEFRQPSRFEGSFDRLSPPGAVSAEQGFGPGPELVVPTPSPVFEFRKR